MNLDIKTIILIRHGCSTANIDPSVYATTPDHVVPLVRPDEDEDTIKAGELVATLGIDPVSLCSWSSTYLRCKQTESIVMLKAFGAEAVKVRSRESFLLREQEFGDWDSLTDEQIQLRDPERFMRRKRMSDNFGRFYFRYPNGESRADVAQRIAIFIGKLHRSRYAHHIIFLHGVTQRAFRMSWFNRPVEWFENEPNPKNASVFVVTRDPDSGRWVERELVSA